MSKIKEIEKFLSSIDKNGPVKNLVTGEPLNEPCWIWGSSPVNLENNHHRSFQSTHFKSVMVHRIAWEIEYGEIPKDLLVCHHCDNKRCVNPAHLFVGTQADNMHDYFYKKKIHLRKDRLISRLLDKVDETTKPPCALWTGAKDQKGYGVLHVNKKTVRAHKLILQILDVQMTPKQRIFHSCCNPSCINPDHLVLRKNCL